MRTLPVLLATATLAGLAARAHADPIRLSRTSANPIVTRQINLRVDDSRIYDMGYRTCDPGGGAYTTKDPALTWELTEALPLRIRLENATGDSAGQGGVIVLPDGRYVCEDNHDQFSDGNWPKGKYKLYLYGQSIGVSARVRFENPSRSQAALAAAIKALPTVTLGDAGAINPMYPTVPATVSADLDDTGPSCGKGRERVMPIARVDVKRAAPWLIRSGDQELFVLTEDQQHCFDPRDPAALPVGVHTLWTVVPRADAPAQYPLEIDDRSAALVFPDAPKKPAGALDAPLVLDGKVRPFERWSSRDWSCRGAARAPDFYLTSDQPVQHVTLSLLWSKHPERLHLFGPIEDAKVNSIPRCDDRDDGDGQRVDILEGTYAIWVGGDDAAAVGDDYHVLVMRDDTKVDPMTTLAPIPAELELHDRAIKNHYPYFRGQKLADWTAIFTAAPDQLFIYPRVDVDDNGAKLPAGEPLLVAWSDNSRTAAYRYDGSNVNLDTRLVSTTRPATVVLPTKPAIPSIDDLSRALEESGDEDAKNIAAYRKIDDKYTSCLGDYLEKHDPTWGHDVEVYKISGGGRVVNVSDEVGDAGARKCGATKVDSAEKKLMKQLATTRAARWKNHLAAVRKRFGL